MWEGKMQMFYHAHEQILLPKKLLKKYIFILLIPAYII